MIMLEKPELKRLLIEHFERDGIEMNEGEINLYTNMFSIILEFVHNKLTFEDIYTSYDYLGDVILGKIPRVAISVPSEDRISIQVRVMEQLKETAGKLTLDEKIHYAYCVYHSLLVNVYDEERDDIFSGLVDFDTAEHIEMCYRDDRAMNPERYVFEAEYIL